MSVLVWIGSICGIVTPVENQEGQGYSLGDSEDCGLCSSPVEAACQAVVRGLEGGQGLFYSWKCSMDPWSNLTLVQLGDFWAGMSDHERRAWNTAAGVDTGLERLERNLERTREAVLNLSVEPMDPVISAHLKASGAVGIITGGGAELAIYQQKFQAIRTQVDRIRNNLQPMMGLVELTDRLARWRVEGHMATEDFVAWEDVKEQAQEAREAMAHVRKALDEIWRPGP